MLFLNDIERVYTAGYTLAAVDSEGVIQKRTLAPKLIFSALSNVDECCLRVWKGSIKGKGLLGTIYISERDLYDYTDNDEMREIVSILNN